MEDRLMILVESRIHGDMYVRFGGEYLKTYRSNTARRWVLSLQRNGRAIRTGNWLAKLLRDNRVRIYIYAVKQSLDNYKFNLLKNKQVYISQMKNCALNVRTIDEGALDEKTGMNFSEYIAVLSGDTSLLEKTKVEKKIAVTESLKKAHFKELFSSKYKLEQMQAERNNAVSTLEKLSADSTTYHQQLRFEKDETKSNPIRIESLNSADPEVIGKHLISVYENWKEDGNPQIGSLYGFDLFVRHHQEKAYDVHENPYYRHYNTLYAESPQTGIKYTYNQGHPNIDNPKLATRYFLNAIDRVDSLKDKYQKNIADLDKEIPMLEQIISRPFEKEKELAEMKITLASLEREITLKIQEKQLREMEKDMLKTETGESITEILSVSREPPKETTVIPMKASSSNIQITQGRERRKGLRI